MCGIEHFWAVPRRKKSEITDFYVLLAGTPRPNPCYAEEMVEHNELFGKILEDNK